MSSNYYQPPESHDHHIRGMLVGLVGFFAVVAVIATLVFVFASHIAQWIPFSVEKRFVRPYEMFAERWLAEPATEEAEQVEEYLQRLVDQLAATMELPSDYVVTVHYLEQDVANAFVTLGGHMFVFKGLVSTMPDENSLAMVLAHELAHIKHRDPVAAMGRGLAMTMLYAFATGDYSAGADVASLGGELGLAKFSREQEGAADVEALHAINAYYGQAAGYDEFFLFALNELEEDDREADRLARFFDSHPATADRLAALEREVERHDYTLGRPQPMPEAISRALEQTKQLP